MKRVVLLILVLLSLSACKTKHDFVEHSAKNSKSVINIINGHYKNTPNFDSAYIRSSTKYEGKGQSLNLTTDIKIKKDEKILINIKFLGISMAKILITPESVSYYEKMNNTSFEGDFGILSEWLGTELTFDKVQNLLLGNAIDNLNQKELVSYLEEGLHKLETIGLEDWKYSYFFEDQDLLLKRETISLKDQNKSISISYPNYQTVQDILIPAEINISAKQEKSIHLNIYYNKVTFNENLSFKYSIPNNFKRININ